MYQVRVELSAYFGYMHVCARISSSNARRECACIMRKVFLTNSVFILIGQSYLVRCTGVYTICSTNHVPVQFNIVYICLTQQFIYFFVIMIPDEETHPQRSMR